MAEVKNMIKNRSKLLGTVGSDYMTVGSFSISITQVSFHVCRWQLGNLNTIRSYCAS